MYKENATFEPPLDDVVLWRYLSIPKLVSLIHTKSLYFSRADMLGDPFEGSVPVSSIPLREQILSEVWDSPSDIFERMGRVMPTHTAVNCWHMNDHESAAMWKLYSPDGEGVAIRSTFGDLKASLSQCAEDVFIGIVRYLDYETAVDPGVTTNVLTPFLRKRISFEHERELRAVIARLPITNDGTLDLTAEPLPDGVQIPVQLDLLVREVRVSPTAPPWYLAVVRAIATRFELPCEVNQSDLAKAPYW